MGTRQRLVVLAGLALALAGTAAQAQVMVMPRHAVVVPTAPAVRTWVPPHWEMRGHSQVWVDGHWIVSQPAHGSADWQAARWVHPRHDLDRDGVPNRYDRDRDGDGVPNRHDRRPDDPRWR